MSGYRAALAVFTAACIELAYAGPIPSYTTVFTAAKGKCYRIPSIIRTSKGTLLAFAEERRPSCGDNGKNDMVLRRSSDDGASWGPIIYIMKSNGRALSNPNPVEVELDNGRGKAVLFHFDTKANPSATSHGQNLQAWSFDDGLTWSGFQDVTHFMPAGQEGCMPGPSIGVQSSDGTVYFVCHKSRFAFLYWSKPGSPAPSYAGETPCSRPKKDLAGQMLLISEMSFDKGGRVDQVELYAHRDDDSFEVAAWRPSTKFQYIKVGAASISIKAGYNKIDLSPGFGVSPGDVLGWYSKNVQPIVFSEGAGHYNIVRRAKGSTRSEQTVEMAALAQGWKRDYSLKVRVQSQLADYWQTSEVVSGLNECSIGMLDNGLVAMNCRTNGFNKRAQLLWSAEGSLLSYRHPPELRDPNCQGSLMPFAGALYLSNDDSASTRSRLTVKRSDDYGVTWDAGLLIWDSSSAYSQLVGWGSTLATLFERGKGPTHITFAKWDIFSKPFLKREGAFRSAKWDMFNGSREEAITFM